MAAQTVFPLIQGIFVPSNGMPLPEESHELTELPQTDLPAPQLVMLANVAVISEPSPGEFSVEEKQMVELKNVGCSGYSDSEDENVVRYSYDNTETSENAYPEDDDNVPVQAEQRPAEGAVEKVADDSSEARPKDLSAPSDSKPDSRPAAGKRKQNQIIMRAALVEPPKKKKKPFFCKPCQFQAEGEDDFVHHIQVHSAKKLIAVNSMGESDDEATETAKQPVPDNASCNKGVIRCERCGYNTNRYDHYMAHLRHHKIEGGDQKVFKCTICPYSTVSQYHWKKHLRNHFPSKLFTCKQCSYFSDRKNNYIQHIRTHTGT